MKNHELMIVGGHAGEGGGGIKTMVLEMKHHLSEEYDVRTYDQTAYYKENLIIKFLLTLWKLFRFTFQRRPDIVHINTTSGFGFYRDSAYILLISLIWRRPVVLRTGGSGFDEFVTTNSHIKLKYFSFILSRVSIILVLTELQQNALGEYVPAKRIAILRQVTNVKNYSPNWSNEGCHILFLSSLSRRKGFHDFAKVIGKLFPDGKIDCGNVTISIAGDGEFENIAMKLERSHECVNYYGYVTGREKFDLFNDASIYVLPTYAEGFPNSIIEAMAAGNAIISTNVSGIPEIINEDNGIIIEPGNEHQLINALRSLIQSPDLVERQGRTNHDLVEKRYTWKQAKRQLVDIYDKVS